MSTTSQPAMPAGDDWVIEPRRDGLVARLRDVWRYRRLLRFFGWKALQKLYARTVLGWSWIFIRPLFPLAVNTIIFSGVLGVGSQGVPYFLFLVTGISIWELFASALTWGTRSLELNRGFMTRIYIPRLILPIAMMTPSYLNFVINLAVIACALIYYRVTAGMLYLEPANLGWAVVAVALALLLALGISLWTSVPALIARDVRFTLGYVLGFWVFLTPVLYPLNVSPKYAWLMPLNPMAAIVNAFKYGVLGIDVLNVRDLGTAALMALAIFVSGLWYFGRAEADAGDKV